MRHTETVYKGFKVIIESNANRPRQGFTRVYVYGMDGSHKGTYDSFTEAKKRIDAYNAKLAQYIAKQRKEGTA